jgi:hypothetical protein
MNVATGSRKPDRWLDIRYNFHEINGTGKSNQFFNTTAYFPDMKFS